MKGRFVDAMVNGISHQTDTNLDEDHVADVDEQPGDEAPLSLLLEFIASGKDRVPDGYITDANGSLRIDTAADMFEEVVVAGEPEVFGRGKRRRLDNVTNLGSSTHFLCD